MPELLFAKGIASKLEQIIDDAQSIVIMISPYVQIDSRIAEKLKFADERGVSIVLLHKPNELKEEVLQFFNRLTYRQLVPVKNLHAKCYLNEKDTVLIGSMNLYKYSEKNNWEMGVYFDFRNGDDSAIYQKIIQEISAMLFLNIGEKESGEILEAFGRLLPIQYVNGYIIVDGKKYTKEEFKNCHRSLNIKNGYCIRCGKEIDFFPMHPYCINCFKAWSRNNDPQKTENHCHRCGKEESSSINQPHCNICDEYYYYELGLYFGESENTFHN